MSDTSAANSATSIRGTLHEVGALSSADRDAMFALLATHFEGPTRRAFDRDLAEKNHVLLLRDPSGHVLGFSTLLVYEARVDGAPISVVCSGDTIVDPAAWASAALPREWISAVNQLRVLYPNGPYMWLLLTSGYRTYRLLSTFWQSFDPSPDHVTLQERQRMIDVLAGERFGKQYDAARGVVRFAHPQRLMPHLGGIPVERRQDPYVAFFAQRNPGHAAGDELVSICDLSESNLTRAGRRVVLGPPVRDARRA